jgi:hypothetical protein
MWCHFRKEHGDMFVFVGIKHSRISNCDYHLYWAWDRRGRIVDVDLAGSTSAMMKNVDR